MSTIKQDCVCFSVQLARPSLRRKVKSSEVECDADKKAIHVSKEILESESYDKLRKLDGEIRTYLYDRCVPSLLRKGVYLLPLTQVPVVEAALEEYKRERQERVEEFKAEYDRLKEEAKGRLRSLYNASDYPSIARIAGMFDFTWRMFSIDTPEVLNMVSRDAFRREQEKAEAFWNETRENVAAILRAELKELIDHLVERLADDTGSKPKIFRNSLVENFTRWVDLFQSRNLAKDTELAELVSKAQSVMSGVEASDLRDSDKLRHSVRQSFEQIKKTADKLVIDKPKRAFNLEED